MLRHVSMESSERAILPVRAVAKSMFSEPMSNLRARGNSSCFHRGCRGGFRKISFSCSHCFSRIALAVGGNQPISSPSRLVKSILTDPQRYCVQRYQWRWPYPPCEVNVVLKARIYEDKRRNCSMTRGRVGVLVCRMTILSSP